MAYTAEYSGSDLGNLFIDVLGAFINVIKDNAATIGILIIVVLIAVYGGRAIRAIFSVFGGFR